MGPAPTACSGASATRSSQTPTTASNVSPVLRSGRRRGSAPSASWELLRGAVSVDDQLQADLSMEERGDGRGDIGAVDKAEGAAGACRLRALRGGHDGHRVRRHQAVTRVHAERLDRPLPIPTRLRMESEVHLHPDAGVASGEELFARPRGNLRAGLGGGPEESLGACTVAVVRTGSTTIPAESTAGMARVSASRIAARRARRSRARMTFRSRMSAGSYPGSMNASTIPGSTKRFPHDRRVDVACDLIAPGPRLVPAGGPR